jgi:hypothetical protein
MMMKPGKKSGEITKCLNCGNYEKVPNHKKIYIPKEITLGKNETKKNIINVLIVFIILIGMIYFISKGDSKQNINNDTNSKHDDFYEEVNRNIYPEIINFIRDNPYFQKNLKIGAACGYQNVSNWTKGKRQWVSFVSGILSQRDFLFYIQDGQVISVYEQTEQDRVLVWGNYSN